MKNAELIARLRSLETDHKPEGWPAIQMRDVSALLDAIEALEAEVERLKGLYESSTAAHEETVGRAMRAEAQLAAAQGQEPAGYFVPESWDQLGKVTEWAQAIARHGQPLYAAPIPQQPALSAPEGWKLVPIEPTLEMMREGGRINRPDPPTTRGVHACGIYRAMLAAAPQPKETK